MPPQLPDDLVEPLPDDLISAEADLPDDLVPAEARSPFQDMLRGISGAIFGNEPTMPGSRRLGPLVRTDAGDFYKDEQGELTAISNRDFIAEDESGQLSVFAQRPAEGALERARRVSGAAGIGVATTTIGRAGRAVSVVPKTPEKPKPIASTISTAPPEQKLIGDLEARGSNAFYSTPEQHALRTQAIEKLRKMEGATEPIVRETLSRDVNQAVLELLEAGEVKLAPDIKISDQVRDLLQTDILEPELFQSILAKNGVNPVKFLEQITQGDLGQAMRESATQSARTLQKLSELRKAEMRIRALSGEQSDEVAAFLRSMDSDIDKGATSYIRRVGNLWRGSLVSQLGTAVRNFETSVARVGMDVFVEGMERGLRSIFSNPIRRIRGLPPSDEPFTAMGNFISLFGPRRAMELTKAIADVNPQIRESLFARYASDVTKATGGTGILGRLETAVNFVNFFNRFQDKVLRSAVFSAELGQRLKQRGLDLNDIVANNRIGSIPDDALNKSVEKALEMTWARPLGEDITSQIVRHWDGFVTMGGRIPNMITPFARFMADAWKFQIHHSPLGALRLLRPSEIKGLTSGDPKQMKVAAQALAGSAALYAGYAIRNSEHAGPQWYEINLPDGRTIDTRPFAPFSTYLFVGDLIKRQQEGTLLGTDLKTIAQGLIGVNFRSGAGLFVVDQLIDDLSGVRSVDKASKVVKNFVGNVVAGFAVPFQTFKDFMGQFDREERVLRETRESPLTGPIRSRIPFAGRSLPEAEFPTREAPFEREQPAVRQLTGITMREAPNAAEAELGRLGFMRREILPATGDIVFDRLMAKHLGPLVENVLGRVVQSPRYQSLDNNFAKAEIIRNLLPNLRDIARAQAYAEDQSAELRLKYRRLPRRQRALIEDVLQSQGLEINLP